MFLLKDWLLESQSKHVLIKGLVVVKPVKIGWDPLAAIKHLTKDSKHRLWICAMLCVIESEGSGGSSSRRTEPYRQYCRNWKTSEDIAISDPEVKEVIDV